jgi:hypothetical protein
LGRLEFFKEEKFNTIASYQKRPEGREPSMTRLEIQVLN